MQTKLACLISLFWAFAPSSVLAEESCATRAAKLIEEGKGMTLASWFKAPTPTLSDELGNLLKEVGTLRQVDALPKRKSGRTLRLSITSKDLPTRYVFSGSWAEAVSDKHGQVQILAAAEQESDCRLLALHVELPAN